MITIDKMNSHVEVTPRAQSAAAPGRVTMSGKGGGEPDLGRLRDMLRPLVVEIVAEELAMHRRING
jgi:hypothetical protein